METKKFNVNYVNTAKDMAKFVEEKDTLYGNALFNLLDEYGMDYALSKMTEKLFRLKQLKKLGKEDHSESFVDSLKDLWGYSFLTILYLEQVQPNKMTDCETDNIDSLNEEDMLIESYEKAIIDLEKDMAKLYNKIENICVDMDETNEHLSPFIIGDDRSKQNNDRIPNRSVDMLNRIENLKKEYSEKMTSLYDKVCMLKYSDDEEEEYDCCDEPGFDGEEYDIVKQETLCNEESNCDDSDENELNISDIIRKTLAKKLDDKINQDVLNYENTKIEDECIDEDDSDKSGCDDKDKYDDGHQPIKFNILLDLDYNNIKKEMNKCDYDKALLNSCKNIMNVLHLPYGKVIKNEIDFNKYIEEVLSNDNIMKNILNSAYGKNYFVNNMNEVLYNPKNVERQIEEKIDEIINKYFK